MKTALVIGAGGFIGRHLTAGLEKAGYEVTTYSLARRTASGGTFCNLQASSPFGLVEAIRDVDIVYNLAALSSPSACAKAFYEAELVNHYAAAMIARICAGLGKRLIHAGTSASNDPERSIYSQTKTRGEQAALHQGAVSLRIYNVYGNGMQPQQAIASIVRKLRAGDLDLFGCDPHKTFRDFIHIDDVVEILVKAMPDCNFVSAGFLREAGTGIATSIMDVALMCSEATGIPLANYKPPLVNHGRPDVSVCTAPLLTPRFIPLSEGIRRYVEENPFQPFCK